MNYAKDEIKEMILKEQESQVVYPHKIANKHNVDYEEVLDVVVELLDEGLLRVE